MYILGKQHLNTYLPHRILISTSNLLNPLIDNRYYSYFLVRLLTIQACRNQGQIMPATLILITPGFSDPPTAMQCRISPHN